MEVIPYTTALKSHIKTLNTEWLEKYFAVEPKDTIQLSDPENEIINKGGYIYYGKLDDTIIATFSLLKVTHTVFELGKMAVSEAYQGKGLGKQLLEYAIATAKEKEAEKIILYSNTKLEAAIALYKKFGFTEIPLEPNTYARSNIKMELII
ncbi:MAG TPA: GNAT family N-acetyltransferase [Flavobacterium sp.]|jgi:ribosomal protein S18 acetylase RimI-like enzyme